MKRKFLIIFILFEIYLNKILLFKMLLYQNSSLKEQRQWCYKIMQWYLYQLIFLKKQKGDSNYKFIDFYEIPQQNQYQKYSFLFNNFLNPPQREFFHQLQQPLLTQYQTININSISKYQSSDFTKQWYQDYIDISQNEDYPLLFQTIQLKNSSFANSLPNYAQNINFIPEIIEFSDLSQFQLTQKMIQLQNDNCNVDVSIVEILINTDLLYITDDQNITTFNNKDGQVIFNKNNIKKKQNLNLYLFYLSRFEGEFGYSIAFKLIYQLKNKDNFQIKRTVIWNMKAKVNKNRFDLQELEFFYIPMQNYKQKSHHIRNRTSQNVNIFIKNHEPNKIIISQMAVYQSQDFTISLVYDSVCQTNDIQECKMKQGINKKSISFSNLTKFEQKLLIIQSFQVQKFATISLKPSHNPNIPNFSGIQGPFLNLTLQVSPSEFEIYCVPLVILVQQHEYDITDLKGIDLGILQVSQGSLQNIYYYDFYVDKLSAQNKLEFQDILALHDKNIEIFIQSFLSNNYPENLNLNIINEGKQAIARIYIKPNQQINEEKKQLDQELQRKQQKFLISLISSDNNVMILNFRYKLESQQLKLIDINYQSQYIFINFTKIYQAVPYRNNNLLLSSYSNIEFYDNSKIFVDQMNNLILESEIPFKIKNIYKHSLQITGCESQSSLIQIQKFQPFQLILPQQEKSIFKLVAVLPITQKNISDVFQIKNYVSIFVQDIKYTFPIYLYDLMLSCCNSSLQDFCKKCFLEQHQDITLDNETVYYYIYSKQILIINFNFLLDQNPLPIKIINNNNFKDSCLQCQMAQVNEMQTKENLINLFKYKQKCQHLKEITLEPYIFLIIKFSLNKQKERFNNHNFQLKLSTNYEEISLNVFYRKIYDQKLQCQKLEFSLLAQSIFLKNPGMNCKVEIQEIVISPNTVFQPIILENQSFIESNQTIKWIELIEKPLIDHQQLKSSCFIQDTFQEQNLKAGDLLCSLILQKFQKSHQYIEIIVKYAFENQSSIKQLKIQLNNLEKFYQISFIDNNDTSSLQIISFGQQELYSKQSKGITLMNPTLQPIYFKFFLIDSSFSYGNKLDQLNKQFLEYHQYIQSIALSAHQNIYYKHVCLSENSLQQFIKNDIENSIFKFMTSIGILFEQEELQYFKLSNVNTLELFLLENLQSKEIQFMIYKQVQLILLPQQIISLQSKSDKYYCISGYLNEPIKEIIEEMQTNSLMGTFCQTFQEQIFQIDFNNELIFIRTKLLDLIAQYFLKLKNYSDLQQCLTCTTKQLIISKIVQKFIFLKSINNEQNFIVSQKYQYEQTNYNNNIIQQHLLMLDNLESLKEKIQHQFHFIISFVFNLFKKIQVPQLNKHSFRLINECNKDHLILQPLSQVRISDCVEFSPSILNEHKTNLYIKNNFSFLESFELVGQGTLGNLFIYDQNKLLNSFDIKISQDEIKIEEQSKIKKIKISEPFYRSFILKNTGSITLKVVQVLINFKERCSFQSVIIEDQICKGFSLEPNQQTTIKFGILPNFKQKTSNYFITFQTKNNGYSFKINIELPFQVKKQKQQVESTKNQVQNNLNILITIFFLIMNSMVIFYIVKIYKSACQIKFSNAKKAQQKQHREKNNLDLILQTLESQKKNLIDMKLIESTNTSNNNKDNIEFNDQVKINNQMPLEKDVINNSIKIPRKYSIQNLEQLLLQSHYKEQRQQNSSFNQKDEEKQNQINIKNQKDLNTQILQEQQEELHQLVKSVEHIHQQKKLIIQYIIKPKPVVQQKQQLTRNKNYYVYYAKKDNKPSQPMLNQNDIYYQYQVKQTTGNEEEKENYQEEQIDSIKSDSFLFNSDCENFNEGELLDKNDIGEIGSSNKKKNSNYQIGISSNNIYQLFGQKQSNKELFSLLNKNEESHLSKGFSSSFLGLSSQVKQDQNDIFSQQHNQQMQSKFINHEQSQGSNANVGLNPSIKGEIEYQKELIKQALKDQNTNMNNAFNEQNKQVLTFSNVGTYQNFQYKV